MSGQIDEAEVARIANGLTKAQRVVFQRSTAIGCVCRSIGTASAFMRLGLATCEFEMQPRTLDWSPLGLAVRKHLEANNAG